MPRGLELHTELTEQIINAAFEVHRILGPALEERFYRDALAYELELRGHRVERERSFPVSYKGKLIGEHAIDLIVDGKVVVELKATASPTLDVHVAQTVSERRVSGLQVALLLNFGDASLRIRRLEARDPTRT
jgi:GxxExxY protein